jgi:hypothetical protein
MSLFKRLLGGSPPPAAEPTEYKGFEITPGPIKEGSTYRIAARIEKEVGGELKSHQLIRADTLGDLDAANEASLNKARQVIDEQGERLFTPRS